jgi:hypothetical protein
VAAALLTTVPVTVAALHAAADLLELAGDFLTDPTAQAEMLETAQLLRDLADRGASGVRGTLRPGPDANETPNTAPTGLYW